ncbi:MAG TPA: rhodanese-like domain-containing protein [Burkholderiales bacterium]|nr:rhodanese-like domain-containing protein [Burkholderiales bacterium]
MLLEFVQNNIWLILLAVASGAMLVWPIISGRIYGGNEVDTLEAVQLINRRDALVLDVSEGAEFAAGHIPHAKHIPLSRLNQSMRELEKFKARPVLVSCHNSTVSAKACAVLRENGFNEAVRLKGGLASWEQASLPIEKGS